MSYWFLKAQVTHTQELSRWRAGDDLPGRNRPGGRAGAPASGGEAPTALRSGPGRDRKYWACKSSPANRRRPRHTAVSTSRALACLPKCAARPISARNSNPCAALSPAPPRPTNGSSAPAPAKSCRNSKAPTQTVPPYRDVTTGIYVATRRAGSPSTVASDPLPWRARDQCQAASRDRSERAGQR
jgi:hypothetical protein